MGTTRLTAKSRLEAFVVCVGMLTLCAVIGVGLVMALLGLKMDAWQTVAIYSSSFISSVLSAYGLYKSQTQT